MIASFLCESTAVTTCQRAVSSGPIGRCAQSLFVALQVDCRRAQPPIERAILPRQVGDFPFEGSLFVPIAPAPAGVEANRPYTNEEFAAAVGDLARAVPELAPDDARGGA